MTALTAAGLDFITGRHLATLTTARADGSPHVTPVGFTWDTDAGVVRVICSRGSQKARNVVRNGRVAVCQVDGRSWLTLEGTASVMSDRERVADAEQRYAQRYRVPRPNPERVVIVIAVTRLMGSPGFIES